MSRAQADGMDVVNMSLGSTFDSWPSYPEAVAAKNLTLAGVVLVVSAGNSGSAGLFAAGTPAVGEGVISVASYETATVRGKALGVGTDKFLYTQIIGAATVPEDSSTLSLRAASNTTACKKPSKVPAGTALLVKYGPCYVWQQMANAEAAGASAVVLYNNKSSLVQFTMGSSHTSTLPGAGISGAKGSALAASLKKSKVLTLGMLGLTNDVTNPDGSKISTVSSAGLSADLRLVPTISAPGGKIYSTLPIELGGHGTMSGTSMAAPFVAGTAALLLEARPTLKGHPADVAQLLYNTATPVSKATESGVTKYPEAVFRQGSGLVKAASAIAASVTASPSVLQLGDGTSDTRTITLTNNGTQTLTYTPTRISGVSAAASTGSATHVGTTTPSYAYGQVGFTTDKATVTLDPGASADVTVTLTAPAKALKGKAGMLYGGWVQFTTTGDGNTVSVPFVGLRGDYQSVKLLNKFRYVDSKGKKYSWPQLGFEDSDGEIYYGVSQKSGKWAVDFDFAFPAVFYHLDYPASDLRLKVIDLTAKTSSWAILDNTTGTAEERTHWGRMSRDAAAQWVTFRGESWSSGDTTTFATDGHAYQLQLKVLKPLGEKDKSSDWESYTSPKFWYLSE